MVTVFVAPASMSPVSPTFVPAVSSLIRPGSPSNVPTGIWEAGVFVRRTTNSCAIVPWFVTENVTDPVAKGVVLGVTVHWFRTTGTTPDAAGDVAAGDGGWADGDDGELEHPT